ncbi:MAG: tRNA pseudouridine(54/55) synthase Pus10 [Planctomycetes bacterium]|nr:tRNA pseudouridine(54/55) synthase Pus10 [Planctomycetota bacterium]
MNRTSAFLVAGVDDLVDVIVRATARHEFTTYLIGSRLPSSLEPEAARETKRLLHADISSALDRKWFGRRVDFDDPEIRILVDVTHREATVWSAPAWLVGRYRKFDRELPQSRWPCRRCRGSGCERCLGTGKTYVESVEEAIGGTALLACEGVATRFHAVGREDVDARMLGTGRPFVLEIVEPLRRAADLDPIQRVVTETWAGRVGVSGLRWGSAHDAEAVKARECEKSYRVVIAAPRPLCSEDAARIADLTSAELKQETPNRVLHRRGDVRRRRRVFRAEARSIRGGLIEARFRVQSGTYVKELVSGDSGRTTPSVSALLGTACRVLLLDVVAVHDDITALPHDS